MAIRHFSFPGASQFAPCGARVGSTAATFSANFERTENPNHAAEIKDLQQSARDLKDVTCEECRKAIQETAKAHAKARRNKEINW